MNSPEPESVKALVQQLMSAKNGELTDQQLMLKIYGDFRWGIKKASMLGPVTPNDIQALIDAAIKRVKKGVRDQTVREQAVAMFEAAKQKLASWVEDENLRKDTCPRCELPSFICACSPWKESEES